MEEEILENQEIIYVEEDIVDIDIIEGEPSTTISEEVKTIDVEAPQEVEVDVGEGFGTITSGNGEHTHPLLYGRDLRDQHPISAITGLEEKLESIESLKTLYSDGQGFANYYKWHEGIYDEFGYFVSLVPHSSMIKVCEGSDIFGVTVDSAAVIGGQDDIIPRDNTYALVVNSGLVSVRCESDVAEGDNVVSNSYGVARKTDSGYGYKVIGLKNIKGVSYAVISLGVQACMTDSMGTAIREIDGQLSEAKINIGAAMRVANEAYQKAGESDKVSQEALTEALKILSKTEEMEDVIADAIENLESVNKVSVEARTIANNAVSAAYEIKEVAVQTSNNALATVNNLVETFEPINTWVGPDGKVGAEYIVQYMDEQGLATKGEIQTVENSVEENKSAILVNAENITSMVSSVDKYSVGEYSQAYGLTFEQAQSILKEGMIYIPYKNNVASYTHPEDYGSNSMEFTMGYYYEWTGSGWLEYIDKVWVSDGEPAGGGYNYWYDNDSLHIYQDGKWTKVATLAGNVNNRITSMIRQDVDEVRAEVVNAYGSVAGFGAKLSDTDAKVNSIASWPTGGGTHNMAVLESKGDGDSAHMVLAAVTNVGGNPTVTELGGAKIVLNDSENGSYIQMDADKIDFTTGDFQIDASHIINLEAPEINLKGQTINIDADGVLGIKSSHFSVDADGCIKATGGEIGGWNISSNFLYRVVDGYVSGLSGSDAGSTERDQNLTSESLVTSGTYSRVRFFAGVEENKFPDENGNRWPDSGRFKVLEDGSLYASAAKIEGNITATSGEIGGCKIEDGKLQVGSANISSLDASQVSIENLKVDATQITSGTIDSARIGNLSVRKITGGTNDATINFAGDITADNIIANGGTFKKGVKFSDGGANFHLFENSGTIYCGIDMSTQGGQYDENDENHDKMSQFRMDSGVINLSVGKVCTQENGDEPVGHFTKLGGISIGVGYSSIQGTSYSSSPQIITSDRNLKHSIEVLNEKYNTLFDNLKPVRFKYNDGTSNRYHTGLIAQDVAKAIDTAGLSTQEVAAYVVRHPNEEDEYSGIRYEEFIALLIQQVQDLKGRVSELEQRLKGENI